jgi:hypothetical protein
MDAQNRFEEAFWGSWALLWEPSGDFVAPFLGFVVRFLAPWLFFSGPRDVCCELWALFLELLEGVFSMFLEI